MYQKAGSHFPKIAQKCIDFQDAQKELRIFFENDMNKRDDIVYIESQERADELNGMLEEGDIEYSYKFTGAGWYSVSSCEIEFYEEYIKGDDFEKYSYDNYTYFIGVVK